MIVKDKEATLEAAHEIAIKMFKLMSKEAKKFECEDDPAEQIYLVIQIMGIMVSKASVMTEGYGKTYGIENLTSDEVHSWIEIIAKEIIEHNKGKYL